MVRQCLWLGVSSSGYYAWLGRQSKVAIRKQRQKLIDKAVQLAFEKRRHRYGSPRLTLDLNESGFAVAENIVAASMKRQRLVAKAGRKFKTPTNSNHGLPVANNLLEQNFSCTGVNQKLCGDITYLWTDEGGSTWPLSSDLFTPRGRLVNESSNDSPACL